MAERKRHQERIDYLHQPEKRRKVAHYLKATNFRNLVGGGYHEPRLRRRRAALAVAALAVLLIGLWFVIA